MINIITTALSFAFMLVLKNDNTHFWEKKYSQIDKHSVQVNFNIA